MGRDIKKDADNRAPDLKEITNYNHLYAYLLIDQLIKNGSEQFYLSPGMRCAPLIWAINTHPKAKAIVMIDERASAFRALGYNKESGKRAVLVCTSGSATGNYLPALIEAEKSNSELIIISADRPFQFVKQNSNQTTMQSDFFTGMNIQQLLLPTISPSIDPLTFSHLINSTLVHESSIHINIPFLEPLESSYDSSIKNDLRLLFETIVKKNQPMPLLVKRERQNTPKIDHIELMIAKSKRTLFIFGESAQSISPIMLLAKKDKKHCYYYSDITSRVFISKELQKESITTDFSSIKREVDLIIHIGGRVTAKSYEAYLKTFKGEIILFSELYPYTIPTEKSMAIIDADYQSTINRFFKTTTKSGGLKRRLTTLPKGTPLTFFKIISELTNYKESFNFFIGNSLTIRAFNRFWNRNDQAKFFFNRGTSGIEGNIATTLGISDYSQNPIIAMIGDVSLIHDLNSLLPLSKSGATIKIIVMNNRGGRIFEHLPIKNESVTLDTITTEHNLTFREIAKNFSLSYFLVKDSSMIDGFHREITKAGPSLIEIELDHEADMRSYI